MKHFAVPIMLFLLSAALSVMALPLVAAALCVGGAMIAIALVRARRAGASIGAEHPSDLLLRSGLAVIAGTVFAVVVISALMSGFFGLLA